MIGISDIVEQKAAGFICCKLSGKKDNVVRSTC